jgi:hypothetical protein
MPLDRLTALTDTVFRRHLMEICYNRATVSMIVLGAAGLLSSFPHVVWRFGHLPHR